MSGRQFITASLPRIEYNPVGRISGAVFLIKSPRGIYPVAERIRNDDTAVQAFAFVVVPGDIFKKSIVFSYGLGVAVLGFRVEKEYITVFHPYNVVHIEQGRFTKRVYVSYGKMGFPLVSVLIPPVNCVGVFFEESFKSVFGVGAEYMGLRLHIW